MKDIQHVVVAADITPDGGAVTAGSQRAAEQAIWLAGRLGARLTFVHSTTRDRYLDPLGGKYVVVGLGPREAGTASLQALVKRAADAGVAAELVLRAEDAWLAVSKVALDTGAGLVIAGKRSADERDGRRLGSVSKRLVRQCPAPVWVTSEQHAGPVRALVAATDFSPVAERAVEMAAYLAQKTGARLHLVHSVPLDFLPSAQFDTGAFAERVEAEQPQRMRAAREKLVRVAANLPGGVQFETHVLDLPPFDAVARVAKRTGVDLVILGTFARTGVARFLLGNTAERLVDGIEASLLAVKPDDFVVELPGD